MVTRMSGGESAVLADGAFHEAMQRAGHLLATRPRSEYELRTRLAGAGFEEGVVDRTVERLLELKLIDDAAFALQWVEERARGRNRSPEILIAELQAKGIDRAAAEAALAAAGIDEEGQARLVAGRLVAKVIDRPLGQQGAALMAMLMRRGFSEEAAEAGARAVLPPEGWD